MLSLPPSSPLPTLSMAATSLELGVLLSTQSFDFSSFERNISQLKPYYALLSAGGSSTDRKCHILGLNLMHLLVENRLSEFHAELELLSETEAATSYISFPITLERQLMVGSYDEVLESKSKVPDVTYGIFMEHLMETVRDSIADCVEVSYKNMKLVDAATMMKFGSTEELLEYVQEKREDWIVEGESLTFQPAAVGGKAEDIPARRLIGQSLSYATELERIV